MKYGIKKGGSMKIIILVSNLFYVASLYSIAIIGHRGACGYAPENTLSSFAKAIECNVDMVEFDVRRCASGELVVFHDAKIDRITNGYGHIASKSLDELKQLKVLESETIPTLKEVLEFIDRRVKVYIELKDLNIVHDVMHIIDQYVCSKQWNYNDFLIASFDHTQLQKLKAIQNNIPIAVLMYGIPINFGAFISEINAEIVCLDEEFITQEFVNDIHNRSMLVYVYTVNDIEDLMRLLSYNVDGIITDYPCDIYSLL